MRRTTISTPHFCTLLALAAVLTGTGLRFHWSLLVPYNDAPDEACHYPMVDYLRREHRPPTMADVPGRIPVSYPALPPLGYLPCVLTAFCCDPDHPHVHHFARLGNVLVGALTIVAAWFAARRLAPATRMLAAAVAWVFALHPQLVFINAYVNNDSLAILLGTLLWSEWIGFAMANRPTPLAGARLGLMAGLALLAKLNNIVVLLAGALLLTWRTWRFRRDVSSWLPHALAVAVVLTGTLVPWLAWNWSHHRAWYGAELHRQWWFGHLERQGIQQGFLTEDNFTDFLIGTWKTFWGSFGYCSTFLPDSHYLAIAALVAALAGAVCSRWKLFVQMLSVAGPKWEGEAPAEPPRQLALQADQAEFSCLPLSRSFTLPKADSCCATPPALLLCGTLFAGIFLAVAAHLHHSAHYGLTAQGRYLMPALFPIAVLLLTASFVLAPSRRVRPAGAILVVVCLAWLQASAIRAERKSNQIRQADRRVKTTLLAYAGTLPGLHGHCDPLLEASETTTLAFKAGVYSIAPSGRAASATVLSQPIRADQLGWVIVEQEIASGPLQDGRLSIVADGGGIDYGVLHFRQGGAGVYRYQFDVRALAGQLGYQRVKVAYTPAAGDCVAKLRRLQILEPDRQTVLFGANAGWNR